MQSSTQSNLPGQSRRVDQSGNMLRQAASHADRTRSEESWIEIASQPSSSSLSSAADDIVTTGLRVQRDVVARKKRRQRPTAPTSNPQNAGQSGTLADASSQEEYEESESESDRVLTSSNEGLVMGEQGSNQDGGMAMSDDDENKTAVNYPIRRRNQTAFTPQPNAFSHPPSSTTMRHASEPCPGSYFPQMSARPTTRPNTRHSFSAQDQRVQHSPYNAISPSHNAAAHHDAALRASLSTLLSCAAAARGLPKTKSAQPSTAALPPSNRIQPNTFSLIPESALPGATQARQRLEPDFLPTIRQRSSSSTSASANGRMGESGDLHKRKGERSSSKERRMAKKARRSPSASSASSMYSSEEMFVSPTLLTWVVSAGVVVVLSAISFSAGYSIGREAGKIETSFGVGGDMGSCASDAGRSGMGLRRLRFAVQA
ncbi:Hypothetical protein D9617_24g016860 [Elsinoe fawcettii]|nr:Hypothetical protein D9617_24g016860 [Elsinoe fawcettii]